MAIDVIRSETDSEKIDYSVFVVHLSDYALDISIVNLFNVYDDLRTMFVKEVLETVKKKKVLSLQILIEREQPIWIRAELVSAREPWYLVTMTYFGPSSKRIFRDVSLNVVVAGVFEELNSLVSGAAETWLDSKFD